MTGSLKVPFMACSMMLAFPCVAQQQTPFWIAASQPMRIDLQVAGTLKDYASVVALRMPAGRGDAEAVARLRRHASDVPLLMYAWVNRNIAGTPGSTGLSDWIERSPHKYLIASRGGKTIPGFGKVTDAGYRSRMAETIGNAVREGGYDGVALDLLVRTPRYRPRPLARLCAKEVDFCRAYAEGIDKMLQALRQSLGQRTILYNGLWNFGPDSVNDQASLLSVADAAIIEYFGGEPEDESASFSSDIQPYLESMVSASADRRVYAFGRGRWSYTDYAEDYARQRYLYAAYLLAAGPHTAFKYHATFQHPTVRGRSGGLSVYADWRVSLGPAEGRFRAHDGLFTRQYRSGLVAVAPDDGEGGVLSLQGEYYTPEGDRMSGRRVLLPGTGVILQRSAPPERSPLRIDLTGFSDLPGAAMQSENGGRYLSIPARGEGSERLLDIERSMTPRSTVRLSWRPTARHWEFYLRAEVDDPQRRQEFAWVKVTEGGASIIAAPAQPRWPAPSSQKVQRQAGASEVAPAPEWASLSVDGRSVFSDSNLSFRRWHGIQFAGPVGLREIRLES
ncbi:MAG: putative glycoside hydrolase [Pseudomonadota bacterium]|nr:putative glycoside hydrolase [Pseudomonadota bacterium]